MGKYLVTGGAGFIGSHITARLLETGHQVRVLDNFSTGKQENLKPYLSDIELVKGDILDVETLRHSVSGMDGIYHQAAVASVPRSIQEPLRTNDNNITGTLNVLIAARDLGVPRVVVASSSSVYGDTEILPKVETMPITPLSPYALQKAATELYTRMFFDIYGLETVALRYFNIFGPRQDPLSEYSAVIPRFISKIRKNETLTIFGDGAQSRDFTYVDNAVSANILAMQAPRSSCGQAYNVGCGAQYTLNELVTELNQILDAHVVPQYSDARRGDVKHSRADISKAQRLLDYKPIVGFTEGLRKTAEWFSQLG
jgi:UDP-glucose 4-epimerase